MQQQQEQNDILEAEVRSLRLESSVKLQSDSELVKSLKLENAKLKETNSTLMQGKVTLEKAYADQRIVMDNLKQSYQDQQKGGPGRAGARDYSPSLTEFDQTSRICDLEVKNSQLTSSLAEKTHLLSTITAKAKNLEQLVASVTSENKTSSEKLQKIHPILKQTEIKYKKSQGVIHDLNEKVARLEDLNETARNTCTMTEARLQEALIQIDELASPANKNSSANAGKMRKSPSKTNGVTAWWIHIANEARKKISAQVDIDVEDDASSQEAARNLVQQGTIISQLRQDLLKAEIVNRQTIDDMEERLKAANVRIATLEQSIRIRRDDGQTKLRELESSLRVVSGRSDLHASLAASRQELASERVKEVHQRGELELQVKLLEDERSRVKQLRAKVEVLNDEVDICKTVKTLENIPGVDPVAIIEQFAGAAAAQDAVIATLKRELTKHEQRRARRDRRKASGSGTSSCGGGMAGSVEGEEDDDEVNYNSDDSNGSSSSSESSLHVPIEKAHQSASAPASADAIEVQRLKSHIVNLEKTLKECENSIIVEKEKLLKQGEDAEQVSLQKRPCHEFWTLKL